MAARMPGRPRDLEKREAIVDAAQALFAERGIEGASIEAIAAASGVSKVTVYSHFGDKAAIFRAMIQRETDRLSRVIGETSAEAGPLRDRLNHFGLNLMQMLSEPCHLALERTLSIEAPRNPEIGRQFFEAGPGRTVELLTALLSDAAARGEIGLDDPCRAARDLVSLWLGFRLVERRYLPEASAVDSCVAAAQIEHGTTVFLRAYAPA